MYSSIQASIRALVFIAAPVLGLCADGYALTLDEFLGDGTAQSAIVGTPATTATINSSAVGGVRTLFAEKITAGAGVSRLETFPDPEFPGDPDYSLGYTQGAHTGQGVVTYDGNNQPSVVPNGLGAVDLTQDGGTAVRLGMKFFDYPSNEPIDITVRLYDTTNLAGFKYSDVTVTINQAINSAQAVDLTIPFSRFTTSGTSTIAAPGGLTFAVLTAFGPSGGVDLTRIGAAQLLLNGLDNANAPDLTIDYLATNGRCTSVPNAQGRVVDECGVCLESPSANKGKDSCGVCLNGPPGYSYSAVIDECGLCPSASNYHNAKDPCGACFGDGSSCADCSGTPHGQAKLDQCGVCAGDGTTCLDCAGAPFGSAKADACGVCSGDGKSCVDCAGMMFGTAKADACGTCGGAVKNAGACKSPVTQCATVAATKQVLNFQKTLEQKASLLVQRFKDESSRAASHHCRIDTRTSTQRVSKAYSDIRLKGREIFTAGVQVCGKSCVTVSYAAQITALKPKFTQIGQETVRIADEVKQCYKRLHLNKGKGTTGVASTLSSVDNGLNQLIIDCRARKVCPPA